MWQTLDVLYLLIRAMMNIDDDVRMLVLPWLVMAIAMILLHLKLVVEGVHYLFVVGSTSCSESDNSTPRRDVVGRAFCDHGRMSDVGVGVIEVAGYRREAIELCMESLSSPQIISNYNAGSASLFQ